MYMPAFRLSLFTFNSLGYLDSSVISHGICNHKICIMVLVGVISYQSIKAAVQMIACCLLLVNVRFDQDRTRIYTAIRR